MRGKKDKTRDVELIYYFVGMNIRRIRQRQKMTLRQLEQRCGIDKGSICDIELAHHRASIEHLRKIAKALGVEPSNLLPENNRLTEG